MLIDEIGIQLEGVDFKSSAQEVRMVPLGGNLITRDGALALTPFR